MRHATTLAGLAGLASLLFAAPAWSQCGSPGALGVPQISQNKVMWDSDVTFTLSNALPGAGWAWAMSPTPGPLVTPFGTFCLDFNLFIVINQLGGGLPVGPTGDVSVTVPFTPAMSSIVGASLVQQALVVDPSAASFFAISNSLAFEPRLPRVLVGSDNGWIDRIDALSATGGSGAVSSSFSAGGQADFALSRDGQRLYQRINTGPSDSVKGYDLSTSPPTFLGEAVGSATDVMGKPRLGIAISHDDASGYWCGEGFIGHFDADPNSPTFMQTIATAPSSVYGVGIEVSADDSLVFMTAGTGSPSSVIVFDALTLTELGAIPLQDVQGLLGFILRYALELSPDGKRLVSVQQGIYAGLPSLDGLAAVNVIDVDPSSSTYLQEVEFHPIPDYGQMQIVFDPTDASGDTVLTLASDAGGDLRVQAINLVTGSVSPTSLGSGGGGTEEGGIATTPNGSFVFVATRSTDTLHVLERSTMTSLATYPLASNGDAWFVHVEDK